MEMATIVRSANVRTKHIKNVINCTESGKSVQMMVKILLRNSKVVKRECASHMLILIQFMLEKRNIKNLKHSIIAAMNVKKLMF